MNISARREGSVCGKSRLAYYGPLAAAKHTQLPDVCITIQPSAQSRHPFKCTHSRVCLRDPCFCLAGTLSFKRASTHLLHDHITLYETVPGCLSRSVPAPPSRNGSQLPTEKVTTTRQLPKSRRSGRPQMRKESGLGQFIVKRTNCGVWFAKALLILRSQCTHTVWNK